MRLIGGQKNRFAGLDAIGFIRNGNFGVSFDDLNERIECGGVFRQTLANSKGEDSESTTRVPDQGTASDHSFLVGHKIT